MPWCARAVTIVVLAAGLTCTLHAQGKKKSEGPSLAGKWSMSVKGTPHGDMTMGLALQQEGEKVRGTFASPHGDLSVEGEFADGTLTLATTAAGDAPHITFTAKLEDDDTLAGYLSSAMGDMTWTARRVKE